MSLSQLPQSVLGNIWSLVNRTKPGQLTREEFYSCLALIALAQKGESLSALCDVTTLPIPFIQTYTVNTKSNSGHPNKEAEAVNGKQPPTAQFATKSTVQTPNRIGDELLHDLNILPSNSMKNKPTSNDSNINISMPSLIPTSLNPHVIGGVSDTSTSSLDFIDFNAVPQPISTNENGTDASEPLDLQKLVERTAVWKSCLLEANSMFREALKLFHECLNPAQVAEVMETEHGVKYAKSLKAVHSIVQRISRSLESYSNDTIPAELTEIYNLQKDALADWHSLHVFLCQECLHTNGEHNYDVQSPNLASLCGICIQPLDKSISDCDAVEFLSHTYHSQCANFYLNRRIGALLPNLI